jgi:hypothetical protein
MTLWEIVFIVVIPKIPIVYVGLIVRWAIKAEPEVGVEGGTEGISWRPWRKPSAGGRPGRSPSRGRPSRTPARASARRERGRVA